MYITEQKGGRCKRRCFRLQVGPKKKSCHAWLQRGNKRTVRVHRRAALLRLLARLCVPNDLVFSATVRLPVAAIPMPCVGGARDEESEKRHIAHPHCASGVMAVPNAAKRSSMPPGSGGAEGNAARKRAKLYNLRAIRADLSDDAFKEGRLLVADFLRLREFEIHSLERAQLKLKYAALTRCFQSLPRTLRRRTALHNVKRVPKRLRNRALAEMNRLTSTTKGAMGGPAASGNAVADATPKQPRGRLRYRLKMRSKLLKLAARIKELCGRPEARKVKWRAAIRQLNAQRKQLTLGLTPPINNNRAGSYDATGHGVLAPPPAGNLKYAKRQQQFVWLPTHVWHAKRAHMIKRYGYQIPYSPTQKCFKLVSRAARHDAVCFDTTYYDCMVVRPASATAQAQFLQRITKFRRAFPLHLIGRVYDDWVYVKGKVVGRGMVYVELGNGAILVRVHPAVYVEVFEWVKRGAPEATADSANIALEVQDCRYSLGSIELAGPRSLEALARVVHNNACLDGLAQRRDSNNTFAAGVAIGMMAPDPRVLGLRHSISRKQDQTSSPFDQMVTGVQLGDPSAISRLLDPVLRSESYRDQLTIKELSRARSAALDAGSTMTTAEVVPLLVTKLKSSGNWCVIMPWFWVLPFWIELCKVSWLHLGGTSQNHQLNFERGRPTFPTDFPFLRDGFLESEFNRRESKRLYDRKPASHRFDFSAVEHGDFHGADWRFLQLCRGLQRAQLLQLKIEEMIERARQLDEERRARGEVASIPVELYDRRRHTGVSAALQTNLDHKLPPLPLVQVRLVMAATGNPHANARIYKKSADSAAGRFVARDLVGFVTTATFNLLEGRGTAIGSIDALFAHDVDEASDKLVVKNIGCTVPRIATWEFI